MVHKKLFLKTYYALKNELKSSLQNFDSKSSYGYKELSSPGEDDILIES